MKRFLAICMAAALFCAIPQAGYAATEESVQTTQEQQAQEVQEATPTVARTEYIPVLMYHHFILNEVEAGNGVTMSQSDLEAQIQYFREQGYQIISLEELDKILTKSESQWDKDGDNGLDLKIPYLCITIDDGYLSTYLQAYPIFQKYQVPASVFGVTDAITNHTGLFKVSWTQANRMFRDGKVRFYNHTSNHVPASKTTTEEYVASVLEAEEALDTYLPAQRNRVKALAYPNGQYTPEIQQALLDEGFSLMFTVEEGVINRDTDRAAIPRIMVASGMTGEDVVEKIEQVAMRTMQVDE